MYAADGSNQRVRHYNANGDLVMDHYYFGGFEYEYKDDAYQLIQFPMSEGRVADNHNDETFSYEYQLKDHLGNVRTSFVYENSERMIKEDNFYYPFGLRSPRLEASSGNMYLYNGKELERFNDLNWYDYGARFYDPQLGRWGVLDPADSKYRGLSPYNYSLNNPINLIDPDGKFVVSGGQAKRYTDAQAYFCTTVGTFTPSLGEYGWILGFVSTVARALIGDPAYSPGKMDYVLSGAGALSGAAVSSGKIGLSNPELRMYNTTVQSHTATWNIATAVTNAQGFINIKQDEDIFAKAVTTTVEYGGERYILASYPEPTAHKQNMYGENATIVSENHSRIIMNPDLAERINHDSGNPDQYFADQLNLIGYDEFGESFYNKEAVPKEK